MGTRVIDNPVWGILPRELSGGVKTLISIYKRLSGVFNASAAATIAQSGCLP